MISRRILAAVALLCAFAVPAHAQRTKAQLNSEITVQFPDNVSGAITPSVLRSVTSDIVNSIMPTAPVNAGDLVCFSGTTGLLQDCTTTLPTGLTFPNPTFTGTTTLAGASATTLVAGNTATANALTINSQGDIGVGELLTPDSTHHISFEILRNQNTDAASTLRNRNDGASTRSVLHFFAGSTDQVDGSFVVDRGNGLVNLSAGGTTGGLNFIQTGSDTQNWYTNNVIRMTLAAASPTLTIGVPTSTLGKLALAGSTSGTTTLQPNVTASGTLTLPAATDTLIGKATADILTNKTFNSTATGNVLQVSGVTVSAGQYPGEPSTGGATAGNVGEVIESSIASGSAVALTSTIPKTITSITLTAGDWEISGAVYYNTVASTSVTVKAAGINTTTNVIDFTANGRWTFNTFAAVVPGALTGLTEVMPPTRISTSGATYFLVGQATFTVSTLSAYGEIHARRAR